MKNKKIFNYKFQSKKQNRFFDWNFRLTLTTFDIAFDSIILAMSIVFFIIAKFTVGHLYPYTYIAFYLLPFYISAYFTGFLNTLLVATAAFGLQFVTFPPKSLHPLSLFIDNWLVRAAPAFSCFIFNNAKPFKEMKFKWIGYFLHLTIPFLLMLPLHIYTGATIFAKLYLPLVYKNLGIGSWVFSIIYNFSWTFLTLFIFLLVLYKIYFRLNPLREKYYGF